MAQVREIWLGMASSLLSVLMALLLLLIVGLKLSYMAGFLAGVTLGVLVGGCHILSESIWDKAQTEEGAAIWV